MPTMKTDYHVGNGKITISIAVGDGQMGTSAVWLGHTKVVQGVDIENFGIGGGEQLRGQTLVIKTVVTDTNDQTNHTCVTYTLSGGVKDSQIFLEATVDDNGDSVLYRAAINLL
jgi:hypothetical protein